MINRYGFLAGVLAVLYAFLIEIPLGITIGNGYDAFGGLSLSIFALEGTQYYAFGTLSSNGLQIGWFQMADGIIPTILFLGLPVFTGLLAILGVFKEGKAARTRYKWVFILFLLHFLCIFATVLYLGQFFGLAVVHYGELLNVLGLGVYFYLVILLFALVGWLKVDVDE